MSRRIGSAGKTNAPVKKNTMGGGSPRSIGSAGVSYAPVESENAGIPTEEKSNIAVIGIGKKEGGGYEAVNIGKDLSPEQKKAVSKAVGEQGRLSVRIEEERSASQVTKAFRKEEERRGGAERGGQRQSSFYRGVPESVQKRYVFTAQQEERRAVSPTPEVLAGREREEEIREVKKEPDLMALSDVSGFIDFKNYPGTTISKSPNLSYDLPGVKYSSGAKFGIKEAGGEGFILDLEKEKLKEYKESGIRGKVFGTAREKLKRGKEEFIEKIPASRPYVEVGAGVIGGVIIAGEFVAYPIKTVKEVGGFGYNLLVDTSGTIQKAGEAVSEDIEKRGFLEVGGEFAGIDLGFRGIGGVARRSPVKITYESFDIPQSGGTTETVYKGVGGVAFKHGVPLVGFYKETAGGKYKLAVGIPPLKYDPSAFRGEGNRAGYLTQSSAEYTTFMKGAEEFYTPDMLAGQRARVAVARAVSDTPSKFIQERFSREVKSLSPGQVEEVIRFAQEEDAQLYGSFGAKAQMPTKQESILYGLPEGRKPGDIDVYLEVGKEGASVKVDELINRLNRVPGGYRVSREGSIIVSEVEPGLKVHAVDVHAESFGGESPLTKGKVFGLPLGQKDIMVEGVKTMPLSEQFLRKAGSTGTAREFGFAPAGHRLKDIYDMLDVADVLYESKTVKRVGVDVENLKSFYSYGERIPNVVSFQIPLKSSADALRAGSISYLSSGALASGSVVLSSASLKYLESSGYKLSAGGSPMFPSIGITRPGSVGVSSSELVRSPIVESPSPVSFYGGGGRVSSSRPASESPPSYPYGGSGGGGSIPPFIPSPVIPQSPSPNYGGGSPGGGSLRGYSYPVSKKTFTYPNNIVRGYNFGSSPADMGKGYDVLVRRGGVFYKVSPFALGRREALRFGAEYVGRTSSATFKIVESFEKPSKRKGKGFYNLGDFVQKGDLFIEKRGRRIKSQGEKVEITFKGISANRKKNVWRF